MFIKSHIFLYHQAKISTVYILFLKLFILMLFVENDKIIKSDNQSVL